MWEPTDADRMDPNYISIRGIMADLARARAYPAGSRMAATVPALTRRYEALAAKLRPEVLQALRERYNI